MVGLFPNTASTYTQVDFSVTPTLNSAANEAVYEDFNPFGNRFDLDGGFVVFTPAPAGGYEIHPVPDVVAPVCSVTSPAAGSTVFEGEPILVEANATDNGGISHVSFQSTAGGLNEDDRIPPFSVPFVVPVGVSAITFNVTAYDSWNNAAACSSTVNVVAGPPPTITVTSPTADTVLTAGSTIPITIDATNRVPVARVDLKVNGVTLSTDTTAPYELMFTVPAGMSSVALSASAVNTVGNAGASETVNVAVVADALTIVQGRVVDRSTTPVGGANVSAVIRQGVSVEVFNLDAPLDAWPPSVAGRTAARRMILSAVNLRNPDFLFGLDPFGLGGAGRHLTRLTARIQTIGANVYTFTLGVNERGLLKVNGVTVVDIPASTGHFQQASAMVDVGVGSIAIEVLLEDNGNPEVQLLYAPPGEDLEVVPTDELTPTFIPYETTSDTSGTFSIAGVPTILGDIGASARFTAADGIMSAGSALAHAPAPGGVIDLGDIVVSSAVFEPDFGTLVAQCDDCSHFAVLPFAFPFFGNVYPQAYVNNNGNITFDNPDGTYNESVGWLIAGPPRIAASWNDWISFGGTSGLYINDQLPGRFVATWFRQAEYCCGGVNTIQLILFADGRIQYGYNGVTAPDAIVGFSPGGAAGGTPQSVDFSAEPVIVTAAGQFVYEQFFDVFDLDGGFVVSTPNAGGGYDIRFVRVPQ